MNISTKTDVELLGLIRKGSRVAEAQIELFTRGWNLPMIHAFMR